MKKILIATMFGAFMVLGILCSASALTITPGTFPQFFGNENYNLTASEIATNVGYTTGTLSELYKQDVGSGLGDEGTFAAFYKTTFSNTPTDPQDALIEWVGPDNITVPTLFLYVKDGSQEPAFYIFNISTWNRTEDITLKGFWPQQGAISHVSIYGGTGQYVPPPPVPEPTTLLLLCLGLLGLAGIRKDGKK